MKKYKVTLTEEERRRLKELTYKGSHRSQRVLNALILLNCDEGEIILHAKLQPVGSLLPASLDNMHRSASSDR